MAVVRVEWGRIGIETTRGQISRICDYPVVGVSLNSSSETSDDAAYRGNSVSRGDSKNKVTRSPSTMQNWFSIRGTCLKWSNCAWDVNTSWNSRKLSYSISAELEHRHKVDPPKCSISPLSLFYLPEAGQSFFPKNVYFAELGVFRICIVRFTTPSTINSLDVPLR